MGYVVYERAGSFTGNLTGQAFRRIPSGGFASATCGFNGSCGWGSFSVSFFQDTANGNDVGFSLGVTIPNGSASQSPVLVDNPTGAWDIGGSGSFSFSCTLQLCFEDVGSSTPSPSSSVTPDAPFPPLQRHYYWRIKPGTQVTGTVTFGSTASATATVSATSETRVDDGCSVSFSQFLAAGANGQDPNDLPTEGGTTGTVTASASASASFSSSLGATSAGSVNRSATGGTAPASFTASTQSGGTSTSGNGTVTNHRITFGGSMSASTPHAYTLEVKLPRMLGSESVAHNLVWQRALGDVQNVVASGGSWSGGYTQERWGVSCSVLDMQTNTTYPASDSKDNFAPVSIALASALTLGGVAVDNALVALLDKQIAGLTLSLPATRALPAGVDTAIGTSGGVSRSWAAESNGRVYLTPWRYLTVRVKATGVNASFAVKIAGKVWTKDRNGQPLKTGTADTFADYVIDLCLPDSLPDSDAVNSTYPLFLEVGPIDNISAETASGQYRTGEGAARGVIQATQLRIEGTGCTLDTVTATRQATPRTTTLWPYKGWQTQRPDSVVSESQTTTTHQVQSMLWSEVDGKPALEEPGVYWESTSGGNSGVTTWSFPSPSIAAVAGLVNHVSRGGWTAAINAPVSSGNTGLNLLADSDYYCRDRAAWGLGGVSGWTHTGGGWSCHIEQDSGVLPWQVSFSSIDFVGGIGDVLGHGSGGTTGAVVLAGCHVFGMLGYGILSDDQGLPAQGTATLTQSSADKGSGTGDAVGAYFTGASYGDGGVSSLLAGSGADAGEVAFTSVTRLRQWAALLVKLKSQYDALCIDSPRQWLHIGAGKKIITYHLQTLGGTPQPAPAFQSPDYAVDSWKKLTMLSRSAMLVMLADKGSGTFGVFTSRDGGKTGQEVLSVTARTAMIEKDSERNVIVCVFENEGNIQRKISRNGGASWEAAADVSFPGGTATGKVKDLGQDGRAGGALLLLADVGGGSQVFVSRDLGSSWTLLLS